MIAANRKTGRLVLTRRDGHGVIAFRNGKIIYAASNSVRETLGNILLHERLITESTLLEALERQSRAAEEKRLGHLLVEMGEVEVDARDFLLEAGLNADELLLGIFGHPDRRIDTSELDMSQVLRSLPRVPGAEERRPARRSPLRIQYRRASLP